MTGSDEFETAYRRGIEFYRRRLFEPDGEARFMSDRHYPIDIHGCAQGVITFSLQQRHQGNGRRMSRAACSTGRSTNMWDPEDRLVLLPAAPARGTYRTEDPRAALVPGLDVVGARLVTSRYCGDRP